FSNQQIFSRVHDKNTFLKKAPLRSRMCGRSNLLFSLSDCFLVPHRNDDNGCVRKSMVHPFFYSCFSALLSFFLYMFLKKPPVFWMTFLFPSTTPVATPAVPINLASRSGLIPADCLMPSSKLCQTVLKKVCSGTRLYLIFPLRNSPSGLGLLLFMSNSLTKNEVSFLLLFCSPVSGLLSKLIFRSSYSNSKSPQLL